MIETAGHEHLNPQDFNAEIAAHGLNVTLKRGIQCPCLKKESGQPDPGCTACEGWGYVWDAGVPVQTFGPNRQINRLFEEPGSIDLGDAYFTFPSETFVSHMDRMVLGDEIIIYSELFTKGEVNTLTGATREKSRFTKILTPVERAIWSKRAPSTGHPYTTGLIELTENVDFGIINGNQVSWLGGGDPPDEGARYSIRFKTWAEYFIWAPRGRAEGSTRQPYRYLCKRLDFIRGPQ